MRSTRIIAQFAAVIVLVAAGCSSSSDDSSDAGSGSESATASPGGSQAVEVPDELSEKPTPQTEPGSAAPAELVEIDVVEGTGAEAKPGELVTVNYVGVLLEDGSEFDASWNRGQPFSFELGAGQVIPGWDEGVAGMKVGGRRELVIPPEMAYGSQGAGGVIPANATLIFVVDLLDVSS